MPEILLLWKEHFSKITNSHTECEIECQREIYEKELGTHRKSYWNFQCLNFSLLDVQKAIARLPLRKASGLDGLSAEHIKYGGGVLALHLSALFQAMLRHSVVPRQFKESIIVPIVKDKNGDASDPDNCRGIAVASVMSKLFERLVLTKFNHLLVTNELQFGFKKNIGCAECSYTLQEAVDYYLRGGTDAVYVAALDLSKAYDRVSHYGLLIKLIQRKFPGALIRLIEEWYKQQVVRVRWAGEYSTPFGSRNGVRQGSVLSPIFFNVFIDDLVNQLRTMGRGARVGNSFVGCIVYADDISLLSPTASGLQEMLDACSHFVDARLLKFNVKKSAVTVFRRMKRSMGSVCSEFRLCGQVLPVSDNLKHLGIVSRFDGKDTSMVESRMRKFYAAAKCSNGKVGDSVQRC